VWEKLTEDRLGSIESPARPEIPLQVEGAPPHPSVSISPSYRTRTRRNWRKIQENLKLGIVEAEPYLTAPMFICGRRMRKGRSREINDLRHLENKHFKMCTPRTARDMARPGDFGDSDRSTKGVLLGEDTPVMLNSRPSQL
jgi:hypothetical protein